MNATANRFSNTQCKLSVLGSLIVAIIGFPAVASASLVGSTVTGGLFYATSPGVFDTYNLIRASSSDC
jgi:hypothetical protein